MISNIMPVGLPHRNKGKGVIDVALGHKRIYSETKEHRTESSTEDEAQPNNIVWHL